MIQQKRVINQFESKTEANGPSDISQMTKVEEINNEPKDLKAEFNKILSNLKIKGEKYVDE